MSHLFASLAPLAALAALAAPSTFNLSGSKPPRTHTPTIGVWATCAIYPPPSSDAPNPKTLLLGETLLGCKWLAAAWIAVVLVLHCCNGFAVDIAAGTRGNVGMSSKQSWISLTESTNPLNTENPTSNNEAWATPYKHGRKGACGNFGNSPRTRSKGCGLLNVCMWYSDPHMFPRSISRDEYTESYS